MNRILCSLFLFFSAAMIFPEPLLFRSNAMGMTLERINHIRRDEFDFILTVEKSPEKEVRILWEKDEEIKRWERITLPDGLEETYYSSGELDTVSTYNLKGDLLKERIYSEGMVDKTRVYIYENGLLVEIIETDSDDTILSTSAFSRSRAGRMQRVVQSFPSGEERISAYTYSSNGIVQEWHGTAEKGDLFRFNSRGETIAEEVWDGADMQRLRRFSYGEGGEYRLTEEDFVNGRTVRKLYDPEDNLLREFATEKGNLVEDIVNYYEEGLLAEKVRKLPGLKERWVYEYGSEDEVVKEEYFRNGELKKVIQYTGDNTYYEDLFRRGNAFIRIYYEDERKVKEEVL